METVHDDTLAALRGRLRETPGLRPVSPGEDRAFWLHDLASTVEGAFGEVAAFPVGRTPADQETAWSRRLGDWWERRSAAGRYGDDLSDRYWLTIPGRDEEAAGTIAVGRMATGASHARLYSLYVAPPFRRQGIATRVLDQVYNVALASDLSGTMLDALWVRQDTLRFYLARRMWVVGWKHSIMFAQSAFMPSYRIDPTGEASLVLSIDVGDGMLPLLAAFNNGTRLGWEETGLYARLVEQEEYLVAIRGQATLALACAVRGWPLIRSPSDWEDRFRSSDVGGPEGLAHKIGLFEAEGRTDGWGVRTPRIPGTPPGPSERRD